jgi:hypothetical protein
MNETSLTQFVQLFTLVNTEATQRVSERLALVLRDPAAYAEEFAEELEERDITVVIPEQELRDVALIDALLSEDLLWEADVNDPLTDLIYGINETLAAQGRSERLKELPVAHRPVSGPDALDALQDALEPLGLALVLFRLDSDAYPLSVLANEQAEEARQLAQELNFGMDIY